MYVDCTNYKDCPKYLSYYKENTQNKFIFLFVGCWGVYCKEGISPVVKYKKGKFTTEEGLYGEKYVINAMYNFTDQNGEVDAVVLAGDNVYSNPPDEERMKLIVDGKSSLYDIDKQISLGFERCIGTVLSKEFLLGVGNHDIENCYVLNQQLNYPGWTMPAISYNIVYKIGNMIINMIFIDTNMYEDKWCQGRYPENAKREQDEWLGSVLISSDEPHWNIVIGHIPFISNPHKVKGEIVKPRIEIELYELIQKYNDKINLYMCADEHNQQYITLPNMPPEVIAGSGGALLDENIYLAEGVGEYTQLYRSTFGFISTNVSPELIELNFYGVKEYSQYDTEQFIIKNRI